MSEAVVLGHPVLNPTPNYRYIRTELAEPQHPDAVALIECWRELEAKGGMRMGRDIPSRRLAKLLPHLLIAEPVGAWNDARIRLAGTALIERFGRDVAGMLTSQIYVDDPEGGRMLLQLGRRAAETREPGLLDARIVMGGVELMHLELAILPIFSSDGAEVWNLVGAFKC